MVSIDMKEHFLKAAIIHNCPAIVLDTAFVLLVFVIKSALGDSSYLSVEFEMLHLQGGEGENFLLSNLRNSKINGMIFLKIYKETMAGQSLEKDRRHQFNNLSSSSHLSILIS